MKRYETMSKEDILKFIIDTSERGDCSGCVVEPTCNKIGCTYNAAKYMQQNISLKPRFSLLNNVEELEKAHDEYKTFCGNHANYCGTCKYYSLGDGRDGCFKHFLAEEVEVTE